MSDLIETDLGVPAVGHGAGDDMHIHKPHPIHGWVEFLKEYGIIVLGVLTALALEQAVEWLHWSHQTRETEETLRAEIQQSVNDAAERLAIDGCLRSQLAALHTATLNRSALASQSATDSRRVVPDLYRAPWRPWARGSWDAAMASNALNHVKPARLTAYAQAYKAIQDIDDINRRERDTKGALAPLADATLDTPEANRILTALTNLDRDRADVLEAGRDLLDATRGLGITPTRSPETDGSAFLGRHKFCG